MTDPQAGDSPVDRPSGLVDRLWRIGHHYERETRVPILLSRANAAQLVLAICEAEPTLTAVEARAIVRAVYYVPPQYDLAIRPATLARCEAMAR